MKKILIALALCLALVGVMVVPAMAKAPGGPTNQSVVGTASATISTSSYYFYVNINSSSDSNDINLTMNYILLDTGTSPITGEPLNTYYSYYHVLTPDYFNINMNKGTATLSAELSAGEDNGWQPWYTNQPCITPNAPVYVNLTWNFNRKDIVSSQVINVYPNQGAVQELDESVSTPAQMTLTGSITSDSTGIVPEGAPSVPFVNLDLSNGVDLTSGGNSGSVDTTTTIMRQIKG